MSTSATSSALRINTGQSTGDHLHFGRKPTYKGEQDWEWWNAEQENGYKGSIDPDSYFAEPMPAATPRSELSFKPSP
jgi:hypothetical protein